MLMLVLFSTPVFKDTWVTNAYMVIISKVDVLCVFMYLQYAVVTIWGAVYDLDRAIMMVATLVFVDKMAW